MANVDSADVLVHDVLGEVSEDSPARGRVRGARAESLTSSDEQDDDSGSEGYKKYLEGAADTSVDDAELAAEVDGSSACAARLISANTLAEEGCNFSPSSDDVGRLVAGILASEATSPLKSPFDLGTEEEIAQPGGEDREEEANVEEGEGLAAQEEAEVAKDSQEFLDGSGEASLEMGIITTGTTYIDTQATDSASVVCLDVGMPPVPTSLTVDCGEVEACVQASVIASLDIDGQLSETPLQPVVDAVIPESPESLVAPMSPMSPEQVGKTATQAAQAEKWKKGDLVAVGGQEGTIWLAYSENAGGGFEVKFADGSKRKCKVHEIQAGRRSQNCEDSSSSEHDFLPAVDSPLKSACSRSPPRRHKLGSRAQQPRRAASHRSSALEAVPELQFRQAAYKRIPFTPTRPTFANSPRRQRMAFSASAAETEASISARTPDESGLWFQEQDISRPSNWTAKQLDSVSQAAGSANSSDLAMTSAAQLQAPMSTALEIAFPRQLRGPASNRQSETHSQVVTLQEASGEPLARKLSSKRRSVADDKTSLSKPSRATAAPKDRRHVQLPIHRAMKKCDSETEFDLGLQNANHAVSAAPSAPKAKARPEAPAPIVAPSAPKNGTRPAGRAGAPRHQPGTSASGAQPHGIHTRSTPRVAVATPRGRRPSMQEVPMPTLGGTDTTPSCSSSASAVQPHIEGDVLSQRGSIALVGAKKDVVADKPLGAAAAAAVATTADARAQILRMRAQVKALSEHCDKLESMAVLSRSQVSRSLVPAHTAAMCAASAQLVALGEKPVVVAVTPNDPSAEALTKMRDWVNQITTESHDRAPSASARPFASPQRCGLGGTSQAKPCPRYLSPSQTLRQAAAHTPSRTSSTALAAAHVDTATLAEVASPSLTQWCVEAVSHLCPDDAKLSSVFLHSSTPQTSMGQAAVPQYATRF